MFNALWNLIPINYKIVAGVILAVIVLVIGGTFYYQSYKIDQYKTKLTTCQTERKYERDIYASEIKGYKLTIKNQNDAIQQYKVDVISYERTIKEKELALIEANSIKQTEIELELTKDSSCENQFKMMNNMLKEFSNGK